MNYIDRTGTIAYYCFLLTGDNVSDHEYTMSVDDSAGSGPLSARTRE